MGGAQLQGQLKPGGHDIAGDDLAAPGDFGRHDGAQAHRTAASDDDGRVGFRMEIVEDGPCPGLDTAAQGTNELQRNVVGGGDQVVDMDH